jgi:hypothetical protein
MLNEVDFSDYSEKFGKPVKVSCNGMNYIFEKSEEEGIIHVVALSQEKLVHIKTIDVRE